MAGLRAKHGKKHSTLCNGPGMQQALPSAAERITGDVAVHSAMHAVILQQEPH